MLLTITNKNLNLRMNYRLIVEFQVIQTNIRVQVNKDLTVKEYKT